MESSDNSLISDEVFYALLGVIVLAILGKYFLENILPKFLVDLNNFWISYKLYVIWGIVLIYSLVFVYILYKLVSYSLQKLKEKIRREVIVEEWSNRINELRAEDITSKNVFELVNFGRKVKESIAKSEKYPELENDVKRLGLTSINVAKRFPILEAQEELDELKYKKLELEREIESLENERLRRARNLEYDKEAIKQRLKREDKDVYKINGRTKKEIDVLKEIKYKTLNEYCVYEKKVLSVLVRKIMGHSRTHVFLVWSVKRLLNSIPGVNKIREYDTKDADLTFEYFGKIYAIEVECGSLIRKPNQMANKKDYLNKKYNKRWFVLISNRNLLSKYKNFGTVTTRKNTEKVLKKMLNLT